MRVEDGDVCHNLISSLMCFWPAVAVAPHMAVLVCIISLSLSFSSIHKLHLQVTKAVSLFPSSTKVFVMQLFLMFSPQGSTPQILITVQDVQLTYANQGGHFRTLVFLTDGFLPLFQQLFFFFPRKNTRFCTLKYKLTAY